MSKPTRWADVETSPIADILRIAAELPNRPERPPITTADALRRVATTGEKRVAAWARAELRRRRRW